MFAESDYIFGEFIFNGLGPKRGGGLDPPANTNNAANSE